MHCSVRFCQFVSMFLLILHLQASYVQLASVRVRAPTHDDLNATSAFFEGDILVQKGSQLRQPNSKFKKIWFSGAKQEAFLWPNGIVPYTLDTSVAEHKCMIKSAMHQIMMKSCIVFREKRSDDTQYVKIFDDKRCYSAMGIDLYYPERLLSLGSGCYSIGTVLHELMHALGFFHEQNRHDRDKYVTILEHNVEDKMLYNFKRNHPDEEQTFTEFDYDSIMLYDSLAFSKDNVSPTIEAKAPGVTLKDKSVKKGLSPLDVVSLNKAYKCSSKKSKACEKFAQAYHFINQCRREAFVYMNFRLAKKMYEKCKEDAKANLGL